MSIYGGGWVARTLRQFGVKQVFSLPGHQILSVYDAAEREGLDLISTRHEASAVYMAQALSFTQRTPGVALLAGGPELTNALTGIAQAYFAGTPLVVIAGVNTLKKRDKGFPQDMEQLAVVRPFTKWARGCYDVRRIPEYIAAAFRQAMRGQPGPAYVEIPYDVMETKAAPGEVRRVEKPERLRPCGEPGALEALGRLLEGARRPLAIAGSGALWSRAAAELQAFVEKTSVPLLLTTGALAMPFPEEAICGWGSMGAGRPAMQAISQADLILVLGTRINFLMGFGQPPFISPRQKLVQIDIQGEGMGANRRVDLGIVGDLKATLQAFNELPVKMKPLDGWRERLRGQSQRFERELLKLAEGEGTRIHPMRLVQELEAARTDDSLLVLDGANSILWALMGVKAHAGGGVLISTLGELEAIGAGVPQALALKRAHPERQVILHTGDGSFGYGAMEMETAMRYGISLVVVVHNDGGWGMTRDMQTEFFGKRGEAGHQLGVVRYDRVVEALGGHGEYVERAEDIRPALVRALRAGKPACVNVAVDPRPKSPGLMMFMLMEVMLGKETFYDRIPEVVARLGRAGLDGVATRAMIKYLEAGLHKEMK
ncbi:MAG: thiamine pyrophosphate-binding protein [Anaerolineales bacterium]|nr:thiamine pyrophosphate-binding protein [Anaerolineales bacterium]